MLEAAIKECIEQGILAEYLEKYASEVINMLFQEWNWDDAKEVWQREAAEREREKFMPVIADKDAKLADKEVTISDQEVIISEKDAYIAELEAQLKKGQ